MSFTHRNHYVPEWYQKRFLPGGDGKYYFLKLKPAVTRLGPGRSWTETACNRWGPRRCFYEDDLYTTRFGSIENDDIERHLFGRIDSDGRNAIDHFCDYRPSGGSHKAVRDLVEYIDAQVLRTPRGLARIQQTSEFSSRNASLMAMQRIRHIHGTLWAECVWEIIDCVGSNVDLLVSDNPVTFYNRALFPGARECRFPFEPDLALIGTQTIFPLSRDKLLVLTNLQFARDPSYDPKKKRINPRYFAPTMFSLLDVITDSRTLDSDAVLRVNYIMKSRAHRFIAASTKDGLYPEKYLRTTHWSKLCENEFLLPDPREINFATATIVGYDDGRPSWGMDEYGRPPQHDAMEDANRAREFAALHRRKKHWDRTRGPLGRPPAHFRHSTRWTTPTD